VIIIIANKRMLISSEFIFALVHKVVPSINSLAMMNVRDSENKQATNAANQLECTMMNTINRY
jgi:hypothetical protein